MYCTPSPRTIKRNYIRLADGRRVHYRFSGNGPPVLLLHQSPTSSAELASEMLKLSEAGMMAIAPDTPGYGQSDALPAGEATLSRFAVALKEFTDAIGLHRFGIYGFHTGAMIGAEFARMYPEHCAAAVLDGFVVMDPAVVPEIMDNYFAVPDLSWEGGHMVWMWARVRDHGCFFPWYKKAPANLKASHIADNDYLHRRLTDYFRTDLTDATAYQAVFLYDSERCAKELSVPTYLVNFASDTIANHPEKLTTIAPVIKRAVYETPEDVITSAAKIFPQYLNDEKAGPALVSGFTSSCVERAFLSTASGNIHIQRVGEGPPVLLLHDAGSSIDALTPLVHSLAKQHTVYSFDWPGHGESDEPDGAYQFAPEQLGALIIDVLSALSINRIDLIGFGAGGTAAFVAATDAASHAIGSVTVIDPWVFDDETRAEHRSRYAPVCELSDYGSHMVEIWYQARERFLFSPWYAAAPDNTLERDAPYELAEIQSAAVDLLRAGPATGRITQAMLSEDIEGAMRALGDRLTLVCLKTPHGDELKSRLSKVAPAAKIKTARYAFADGELDSCLLSNEIPDA